MKYPIGIQDFEKIRKDGYVYVDKTAYIYKLATEGAYYFLSRPRRFGKSLLISTMEAYFKGKKELFEGLSIAKLEKEWRQYPVLHLDLNSEKYDTVAALYNILDVTLSRWEDVYGKNEVEKTVPSRFMGVIRRAAEKTGQRVVILIDEYDKPMLQAIDNEILQDEYRNILKAFYSVLKTCDAYIQFAFLTGVTKFGKVSVFSDLNNLQDLSMLPQYVDICGMTEEDLHHYFDGGISELATFNEMTNEQCYAELKSMYDGYHFFPETVGIYNPFSVLNTMQHKVFNAYWFETGTPTFLVTLLKKHHYPLEQMEQVQTTADVLNSIDTLSDNPIPLIYQAGYLTIKGYDKRFKLYQLGFPNKEVEEGFMQYLLPFYCSYSNVDAPFQISQFVREVEAGETEKFLLRLTSFFADTPYELVKDLENHYQNVLFILTKLLGFYVKAEYHTSAGRIDLVLQTGQYTYIMEFKLDGTAEEALAQINCKDYPLPFVTNGTTLVKIGLNFSKETRNIEKWVIE